MSEPFIGQIQPFGFNFAPRGWAKCDGQLLAINQYQSLYALLGTIYGGDGRTTFGLPDLRGRAALHQGRGSGLTDRRIGQRSGEEHVTLNTTQIPVHDHAVNPKCHGGPAASDGDSPVNAFPGIAGEDIYNSAGAQTMGATDSANTGGGQSHDNMQPYLVVNWCIALLGVFPSRS